ncbi:MAG: hypothetical protein KC620_10745, partial [Myxococcales bacterium]|nr:hypothetical protein [Myxococcales bacterium]
ALLRAAPDIDGDGAPDVDVGHLFYYGVSLGGLLGPGLIALDGEIDMAILSVPGGHLTTFITDNSAVDAFRPVLINLIGGEEEFDRLLPVVQALIDPADPATFAPFVLGERLAPSAGPPNLLVAVAAYDDVVPPSTGRALARALGAVHVSPVVESVDLLPVVDPPVKENLAEGTVTAGFFQLDRVTDGGRLQPAEHTNTPLSIEAQTQMRVFIMDWLNGGAAVIDDPYRMLDTPPLP